MLAKAYLIAGFAGDQIGDAHRATAEGLRKETIDGADPAQADMWMSEIEEAVTSLLSAAFETWKDLQRKQDFRVNVHLVSPLNIVRFGRFFHNPLHHRMCPKPCPPLHKIRHERAQTVESIVLASTSVAVGQSRHIGSFAAQRRPAFCCRRRAKLKGST
jgi:hypothetical protein